MPCRLGWPQMLPTLSAELFLLLGLGGGPWLFLHCKGLVPPREFAGSLMGLSGLSKSLSSSFLALSKIDL